jgi:hypothetical protein
LNNCFDNFYGIVVAQISEMRSDTSSSMQ